MKRRHLFEIEDQPWFPSFLRDYMTDFLRFVGDQFDIYEAVEPLIVEGIRASGTTTMVDLASGGGGGLTRIGRRLRQEFPGLEIVLTDLFPNPEGLASIVAREPEMFRVEPEPVDARAVPERLRGLRTQFLSLHHFRPDDAVKILQNAVISGSPIGVFEAQRRDVAHLLKFSLSPLNVLLVTPLIRPFRLGRLLLTYLIPIVPLFVGWDGVVSVLRTYSPDELRAMIDQLDGADTFEWKVGETKSGMFTLTYLLGCPKDGSPEHRTQETIGETS